MAHVGGNQEDKTCIISPEPGSHKYSKRCKEVYSKHCRKVISGAFRGRLFQLLAASSQLLFGPEAGAG